MSECIALSAWMPHALLAVLALGVGLGSFISLGIDRAELASYRRIARNMETSRDD